MRRTLAKASAIGAMALLALWAFVEYLQPGFTGEAVRELLRCG